MSGRYFFAVNPPVLRMTINYRCAVLGRMEVFSLTTKSRVLQSIVVAPPLLNHVTFFMRFEFSRTSRRISPNAPNTIIINTVDNTLASPNLKFSEKL